LYKIDSESKLIKLKINYLLLSKRTNKYINLINKKKQQLIFLRAPKHFNIGKHKIHSFDNINNNKILYNDVRISTPFILYGDYRLIFEKLQKQVPINTTLKIKSFRITIDFEILWKW